MGPRRSYVSVKLGDVFFASLSSRQRHVSITFLLYVKVTGVTQSASAFGMTSRKSIPMPTACEIDLTITRKSSFHEDNSHSELQLSDTSFKLISVARCAFNKLPHGVMLLICTFEAPDSNLGRSINYPYLDFSWFSSVRTGKCQDTASNSAKGASFHILPYSLFRSQSTIRRFILIYLQPSYTNRK